MNTIIIDCGQKVVHPGETVSGKVLWELEKKPRGVELELRWYTSGRGTADTEVFETISAEDPDTIGELAFSFVMPEAPYSFSGKLISVIWALTAVAHKKKAQAEHQLILSPTGKEVNIYTLLQHR